MNCQTHPERKATALCSACGRLMCDDCAQRDGKGAFICGGCLEKLKGPSPRPVKADDSTPTAGEEIKAQAAETLAVAGKAVHGAQAAAMQGILTGVKGLSHFQIRRLVAFAMDLFLSATLILILYLTIEFLLPLWDIPPNAAGLLARYAGFLIGGAIYFVGIQGFGGQTPGKRLMGLRVVRMVDNKPMGWFTAFWRWVGLMNMLLWTFLAWVVFIIAIKIYRLGGGVNLPQIYRYLWLAVSCGVVIFLSSGILISFMGRNKRGLHDIVAGTRIDDVKDKTR